MSLTVAEVSIVSPLGSTASEHVFFHRAEVTPNASGAFTTEDGEPLPVHDCTWIPASRPWSSRLCLLAKQALGRAHPTSSRAPILLVAPAAGIEGDAVLQRFLRLFGHEVRSARAGAASFVQALAEAKELLETEPEVVVLAVDSQLERGQLEQWLEQRYSAFTRNPYPPAEGAAALRLVSSRRPPFVGTIAGFAAGRSEAHDDNDVPADGTELARMFAALPLPARVPLVVGQHDVDSLRQRDFQLAAIRARPRLDEAQLVSLENRIGSLGAAAGLMATAFALAWLRHGLPLPSAPEAALCWARSPCGALGAALVRGAPS